MDQPTSGILSPISELGCRARHAPGTRLSMTKPGYDPAKPLTWSDLPTRPFATATDPSLVKGAYRIAAKLPADRSGRHVL
ncbi:lytic polysaccharide monooxygenase, partial [Streptomyces sp. NPDC005907]|uniref:lytic polysaccharide monooxygenase n=1 Tax=Streptomyces sp. NPDC005907 TaxID=3154571 RepID=UPI0033F95971